MTVHDARRRSAAGGARVNALALMFGAGSVLALGVLWLPGTGVVDTVPWALNASIAIPVALLLWRFGGRLPVPALHACLAAGSVIVAAGMVFGNGTSLTVAAGFFYIWVSLYVFSFFSWKAGALHLAGNAALLTTALHVSDVQAAIAVVTLITGTAAVVGVVTGLTRAELVRLATADHLTRLPNRAHLEHALAIEHARSVRTGAGYSVLIIDLDGFKQVNDTKGHQAGDRLLVECAGRWTGQLRPTDTLVRYGGDEFLVLAPASDAEGANAFAQRLVNASPTPCSVGAATWQPGDQPDDVLRRADQQLYASKRQSRGTVASNP